MSHTTIPPMFRDADGRLHIRSRFMRESLQDRALIRSTYTDHEVQVLPDANIVHLGGASILDRGREALLPLVDEIVSVQGRHRTVLTVGGGARERHTYALGTDLGLPVGGLAAVSWMVCQQNAVMLYHLLARHKAIEVPYLHYEMLPVYLREGSIPILMGMPTHQMWEQADAGSRIPPHRPDTGALLLAEVLSARSLVYVKDVDGVFEADPKRNPEAKRFESVSARELLESDIEDLPIERSVLEILLVARNCKAVRIINGLERTTLARALDGEPVGTLITQ